LFDQSEKLPVLRELLKVFLAPVSLIVAQNPETGQTDDEVSRMHGISSSPDS